MPPVTVPLRDGLVRRTIVLARHIVTLWRTLPRGWRGAARPRALSAATDLTVYELHVRDFSLQDSTVRPAWRGKYLAFAEPRSAGKSHLRLLARAGMTDVHLLPAYDLASIPELGCVNPQIPSAAPDAEAQQAAISPLAERDCFNTVTIPSITACLRGATRPTPTMAPRASASFDRW